MYRLKSNEQTTKEFDKEKFKKIYEFKFLQEKINKELKELKKLEEMIEKL